MANALLSVTFPFLIFLAAYFAYWPLVKGGRRQERQPQRVAGGHRPLT